MKSELSLHGITNVLIEKPRMLNVPEVGQVPTLQIRLIDARGNDFEVTVFSSKNEDLSAVLVEDMKVAYARIMTERYEERKREVSTLDNV